ncbi:MAG TPA: DUF262 domain-containing protein [Candidatus Atribacteria bacterium]|nr:MAG: DUF262 domain-containing protein [Thermodesulfobacteriota bacterium]HDK27106.1 DUF262 domain-containing protein [Candidatus Atribacteria bacterium]
MSEEKHIVDEWIIDQTEEAENEEKDVITYEISYYPADITLKGYLDKWNAKQLVIPPFQRNYIWDQVKASKLIESFLLGLPVPGVFLYKEKSTNKLLIIDGQQRILTIIKFFKNEFGERIFRLKNVQDKWEGKTYEDLDEPDKFQLHDTVLRATIIQQLHPEDDTSIYHIFERLNTGGVNLNPMEVRKCVYYGEYIKLLEELNTIDEWRKIIGKPKVDKRLRDIELILRLFALRKGWKCYEKPMKSFLNKYLLEIQKLQNTDLNNVIVEHKNLFYNVCLYLLDNLGEKPFHLRGRLNYAVLDSVMAVGIECADKKISNFKEKFDSLIKDSKYIECVTQNTSDEKVVKTRFELAYNYLLSS